MSSLKYTKPELITLANHSEFNERWVQERIAEDPSLLGLGDIILKDKERKQHQAGRLDLLCQDVESKRRYEIEVQLGKPMNRTLSAPSNTGTLSVSGIRNMTTRPSWLPKQ